MGLKSGQPGTYQGTKAAHFFEDLVVGRDDIVLEEAELP